MPKIRPFHLFGPALLTVLSALPVTLAASEWHVAAGGSGNGSAAAPFGRVQDALLTAQPGDTVTVGPGTFTERLTSLRAGTAQLPITLRAAKGRGSTIITAPGRVLTVGHAYVTVDGLVLDGQFGGDDLVRVASGATRFVLKNTEVRRTSRDAIDMGAVQDVLIEGALIHHALNSAGGRTDAHGIVAGAARRLTIRNTEIHTFSGDAVQVDPGRSSPGWSDVLIEGCRFWLQPLPAAVNGFPAGTVPGENAVDTKASLTLPRAKLTIRNTEAFGFRGGVIGNMAAFNIKENVDAIVDGVTVYNSEIAFRLRAPAWVRVQNVVIHSVAYGIRYEDNIENLRLWNSTFGGAVDRPFYAASSAASLLDVRNVLVLGAALPKEAAGASNLAVLASAFANARGHDYQLGESSPAVDTGVTLTEVPTDRQGVKRPQGARYDIGAFERFPSTNGINPEIVLHAWKAPVIIGNWHVGTDPSAAGGARIASVDNKAPKVTVASASPSDYFELGFAAEAGRPYRLWMRGKGAQNYWANDSVFAQFSGSIDAQGRAVFRIGTTSAADLNLEDCTGCGISEWGWQDNGWGVNKLGPLIYFAKTGPQTLRVQNREDGFSVDQIVLSPAAYLTRAPGALKNDQIILTDTR